MITDRVPGETSGYGIRVANVIDGIVEAAGLHLCVIDSSLFGADLAPDERYRISVIDASELPRWRRAVERLWTIPNLAYDDEERLRSRIATEVGGRNWDLVWFSRARVHRLCADLFDAPRILDLDDLNDRLLTSLAAARLELRGLDAVPRSLVDRLAARRWRRYHHRLAALPDRLVVTNEIDAARLGAPGVAIVPNGYRPFEPPAVDDPGGSRLLFVGPLHYEPNYLAVRWLAHEVLDLIRERVPDTRLSVVGDLRGAPTPPDHEAIDYHGFVDDVAHHYTTATLAVAPLRAGGGTRIKILEAMARRRAMVATTFAIEGLDVVTGRDVEVADSADAFADRCVTLLTDGPRRREMVQRAEATFQAQHTARLASERVTELIQRTAIRPTRPMGPAT